MRTSGSANTGDVIGRRERLQARCRLRADERTSTPMRRDKAVGAQAQQRFTHDRARHAVLLGDLVLRWQLVADVEAAADDAFEYLPVNLIRQAGALASGRRRIGGRCGGFWHERELGRWSTLA